MQTTVDIDERVLREAQLEAERQGKSLGAVIEDALRAQSNVVRDQPLLSPNDTIEGLEDDDPFFAALAHIRGRGLTQRP